MRSVIRFLTAVAVVVASTAAQAGAISTNVWYVFGFYVGFSSPLEGWRSQIPDGATLPDDGPWTFTLAAPAVLSWTDLQNSGDRFEFFDNGVSIGVSGPDVPYGSGDCDTIACALGDSNYGKGSAILGAGNHSLSGTFLGVIGNGFGGFIIPEPGTLALIGMALASLAFTRRRT